MARSPNHFGAGLGTPGSSGNFNSSASNNKNSSPRRPESNLTKKLKGSVSMIVLCIAAVGLLGYQFYEGGKEFKEVHGGRYVFTQLDDNKATKLIDRTILAGKYAGSDVIDLVNGGINLSDKFIAAVKGEEVHDLQKEIPVYVPHRMIIDGWDDPSSYMADYQSWVQEQIFWQAKMHHNSTEPLTIFVRTPEQYRAQEKEGDNSMIDVMQCNVDPQAPGKRCGKNYQEEGAGANYSRYYVTRSLTPKLEMGMK